MTQEEVALAAGTDVGYLSRIERGDRLPSLALLENIAKTLNTTPSAIYAAAEALVNPMTIKDSQSLLALDVSEEAINLRLAFRELTKANQRIAVELLRTLKRTQS